MRRFQTIQTILSQINCIGIYTKQTNLYNNIHIKISINNKPKQPLTLKYVKQFVDISRQKKKTRANRCTDAISNSKIARAK